MLDVNGNITRLTISRGSAIESFVQEYGDHGGNRWMSMKISIYPCSHKDGAFSAPGDSGSIVADDKARIIGVLTGGASQTDSTDVFYLLPY